MSDAERAFYKLISELASEGLFNERDGVAERILDAFEAAMVEARSERPGLPQGQIDQPGDGESPAASYEANPA